MAFADSSRALTNGQLQREASNMKKRRSLENLVRSLFRRAGLDVALMGSVQHARGRRQLLLQTYGVELVIDVGANSGQYGRELRRAGYCGVIESFEPLQEAYASLARRVRDLDNWRAHNYGLSDCSGELPLNVSANSVSSSLLGMLPSHLHAAPRSQYTHQELVELRTLDSVFASIVGDARRVFLKIDTQGAENKVLAGAQGSLEFIDTVELEMSLAPLYEGQALFSELHSLMLDRGYELVSVAPGFTDASTGELLQLDGTYHRASATSTAR